MFKEKINIYNQFTPIIIYFLGQIIFLIPLFFSHRIFIGKDPLPYGLLLVHISCFLTFFVGSFFARKIKFKKFKNFKNLVIKTNQFWFLFFLIISLIAIQYYFFNNIPVLSILFGNSNINEFNEMNNNSNGILGIWLLLSLFFLIIFCFTEFKSRNIKVLFFILIGINVIFQAKRQLLFIWLFTLGFFSKKTYSLTRILLIISFAFFVFISIGVSRSGGSIFDPLLIYIGIPIVNASFLFNENTNFLYGIYGVQSIFYITLPSYFGGFSSSYILPFPSGGPGMIGLLFYRAGIVGASLYTFILGFLLTIVWKFGKTNNYFRSIFAFSTWPLFSTATYIHFSNAMFYILPILLTTIFIAISTSRKKLPY